LFAAVERAAIVFLAADRAGEAFLAVVDREGVAFFAVLDRADVAARDLLEVPVFAAGFAAADLVEERAVRLTSAAAFFASAPARVAFFASALARDAAFFASAPACVAFFASAPARDAARLTDASALRAVVFTAVSAFLTAALTRASAVFVAPARDDERLLDALDPLDALARPDDDEEPAFARGLALRGAMVSPPSAHTNGHSP
jgi:hypothetical protein